MGRFNVFTLVVLGSVLVAACSQGGSSSVGAAVESAANTKYEISELSTKVTQLESKVMVLEFQQNPYQTATFDPGDAKGYQRIDANVGTFLMTLDNVEPYLDGQKITLLIGNPNNMNFSGFKMKVKWGLRMPDLKNPPGGDFNSAWDAYQKSTKEKELSFTEALRPGMWNKVKLTISPAPAAEFGRFEVSMRTDQVSLIGGK